MAHKMNDRYSYSVIRGYCKKTIVLNIVLNVYVVQPICRMLEDKR